MNTPTLKEFLKKYSTLSNEFIDDFYAIYDFNEYNNDDFIININVIVKWLKSRKSRIKDTLTTSYNLNIDYKVSKEKPNLKVSKSNKEIIMLTPDCFKRLCLLSKTRRGEEVRTYFLELEKLINNYKNYVISGLQSTIKVLENNQKPTPTNTKGVVYILRSPKDIDGIYRFGKSKDFKDRLTVHNSSNSDKMEVLYIFETKNAQQIEGCVISQIKQFRYKKRKDFYQVDIDVIKQIIKSCNSLTLKYKKALNKSTKNNNLGGSKTKNNLFLYIQK